MAGIVSLEDMLTKFNMLYRDEKFTDIDISIFERENAGGDATLYTVVKSHTLVLFSNSSYFQEVVVESDEGRMKIDIFVKKDHGRVFHSLISSFYNKECLVEHAVVDLLKLLLLGDVYANDHFTKFVSRLIENRELDYSSCTETLNTLCSLKVDNFDENLTKDLKTKCVKFLANVFCPLEYQYHHDELQNYLSLDFSSLVSLFESDENLFCSEQSLVMFSIAWLDYDMLRQNEVIIERILKNLRMKQITAEFLHATFTFDHSILCKWAGYQKWLYENALLSNSKPEVCARINPDYNKQVDRNLTSFNGLARWMVYMTPEETFKRFGPTRHLCVRSGLQFSPVSIEVAPKSNNKYKLSLSIQCSNMFEKEVGFWFSIGILPADRKYELSNGDDLLKLSQHTTWVLCKLSEHINKVDCFTVTEQFMQVINQSGLYCVFVHHYHSNCYCSFTKKFYSFDQYCNNCERIHLSSGKAEVLLTPIKDGAV